MNSGFSNCDYEYKKIKMRYHKIPDETVRRLPVYFRALRLSSGQGWESISSKALADFVGVHPWQIRKDFSYFGDFGIPGVGYNIAKLKKQIGGILKLTGENKVVLVGVGNLGSALLAYPGFGLYGFKIVEAFDNDREKIGRKLNDIVIKDVCEIATLRNRGIQLAIIAVPLEAAQSVAEALVAAGVKGILNFSPYNIVVPNKVKLINIDIATELAQLPYYTQSGRVETQKQ